MLPSNSNLSKENCSSVSSNCVIWQGPNIECLNLCNGDTISDVMYKLATEVCILIDNIGISSVDLSVIITKCDSTVEPSKTLTNVLNLLINKVICLADALDALPDPGVPFIEPTITPPSCALFSGSTPSLLTQFVVEVANKLCQVSNTVNNHAIRIIALETDVQELQDLVPTPLPELESCLTGDDLFLDVLVDELQTEFCKIRTALGTQPEMITARGKQCANLKDLPQLMVPTSPMSNITGGWVSNPQNLANSINNLWLTVCDIRGAVQAIQDNCCSANCSDIVIDFLSRWSSDSANTLLLNFKSKSELPIGFYDCNQDINSPDILVSTLTITDIDGFALPFPTLFRSIDYPNTMVGVLDMPHPGWAEFDLSGSGLNTTGGPLTITADLCFTNGSIECTKCYTWEIPPYTGDCCLVTATGNVAITYSICLAPTATPSSSNYEEVNPVYQNQVNNAMSGLYGAPTTTCTPTSVTINLTAGQTASIPKGATVTSLSPNDANLIQSTCLDLSGFPTSSTTTSGGGGTLKIVYDPDTAGEIGEEDCLNVEVNADPFFEAPGIIPTGSHPNYTHNGLSGVLCLHAPGLVTGSAYYYDVSIIVDGILQPGGPYELYTEQNDALETTVCMPISASPSQEVILLLVGRCS